MRKRHRVGLVPVATGLVAALVLGWMGPAMAQADSASSAADASDAPSFRRTLTMLELRNATYRGIYDAPVTLTDGSYAGAPFTPDTLERPRVELLDGGVARGDVDADGDEDAVVLLVESSGGTGRYLHVAVVVDRDGSPVNVATTMIGDRIPVRDLAIASGRIVADLVVEGPGDAACCKFSKERWWLELQGEDLVVVEREAQGRLSLDDLAGDRWRLRELGADRDALASVVVTLELVGDRLIGSAGCNRYQVDLFPSASSEIPTDFTLGPVLATRAYCDPLVMAQEDEFLAKLGASYDFGFSAGDLWVRFAVGRRVDQLVFERYSVPSGLVDVTWRWTAYADPVAGETRLDEPDAYRLAFQANDRVRISTPCFAAEVPYVFEGGTLRIDSQGVEAWSCAEDDPTQRLLRDLPWVRLAAVDLEDLRLELLADGGVLFFERVR